MMPSFVLGCHAGHESASMLRDNLKLSWMMTHYQKDFQSLNEQGFGGSAILMLNSNATCRFALHQMLRHPCVPVCCFAITMACKSLLGNGVLMEKSMSYERTNFLPLYSSTDLSMGNM